jgi:Family of unknown function (DUF5681)
MSREKKPQNTGPVGYGRPPVHSRFRKGQSGNPTGKRRADEGERAKKLIRQEAYRLLTIREGDKVMRMPALRAVVRSQFASAVKGSVAAQRAAIKAAQDIEAEERASKTAGTESRRLGKDVNEVTDEELMAIVNLGNAPEA